MVFQLTKFLKLVGTASLIVAMGCSGEGERDLSLIDQPVLEEEALRRQGLEALTLVNPTTNQTYRVSSVASQISAACNSAATGSGNFKNAQKEFCLARYHDAVAGINPLGLTVTVTTAIGATAGYDAVPVGTYRIPPQSTGAKYSSSRDAWTAYSNALLSARQALYSDLATLSDADTMKVASIFSDSFHSAIEAIRKRTEFATALAERETASTPSDVLAQQRAMYYRVVTARSVVNNAWGQEYLPPPFQGALCSREELSYEEKDALKILRKSGVAPLAVGQFAAFDPSIISGEIDLQTLLDGSVAALPSGSLRQRYQSLWDVSIPPGTGIAEFFGIRTEAFQKARLYLAEEIRGLNRSRTGVSRVLPGGYDFHVGVSESKPHREGDYVTALMRTSFSQSSGSLGSRSGGASTTPRVSSRLELGGFVDDAVTWARYFQSNLIGASTAEGATIRGQMNLVHTGGDLQGRITYCYNSGAPGAQVDARDTQLYAHGWPSSDGLIVVAGEDNKECAVYGNIEGAPCSITPVASFGTASVPPEPGFSVSSKTTGARRKPEHFGGPVTVEAGRRERWYVLKPRVGAGSDPGDYEPVVGFVPQGGSSSGPPNYTISAGETCVDVPVVPELDELGDKLLSPSPEWCGQPRLTCAGTTFDERLPLENELSDDGNGVESSWKTYLGLARSAANESDLLGMQYIDATLSKYQRKEDQSIRRFGQEEKAVAALEDLQDICGTAVDIPVLLAALSGTVVNATGASLPASGLLVGACGTGSLPACSSVTYNWFEKVKATDSLADLEKCVSSFADVKPYVHLGDADLCLWENAGVPCGGEYDRECPFEVASGQSCLTSVPEGTTAQQVPASAGLGFFRTADKTTGADDVEEHECDVIRRIRRSLEPVIASNGSAKPTVPYTALQNAIQSLSNKGFFQPIELTEARERLAFEARYGSHSAILINGYPVFETGSFETGPSSSGWPCHEAGASNCSSGDGLMCEFGSCAVEENRYYFNDRMSRAVAAAYAMTTGLVDSRPVHRIPLYVLGAKLEGAARTKRTNFAGTKSLIELSSPAGKVFSAGFVESDAEWVAYTTWSNEWLPWGINMPDVTLQIKDTAEVDVALDFALWPAVVISHGTLEYFFGGLDKSLPSQGYFWKSLSGNGLPIVDKASSNVWYGPFLEYYSSDNEDAPADAARSGLSIYGSGSFSSEQIDILKKHYATYTGLYYRQSCGFDSNCPIRYDWGEANAFGGITLGPRDVWDGLELLCEAKYYDDTSSGCSGEPPEFNSLADLPALASFLECMGQSIENDAARAVFQNFPTAALDPLRQLNGSGVYERVEGRLGDKISELHGALLQVSRSGPDIGLRVSELGSKLRKLQHELERYDVQAQMSSIRFSSQQAALTARCLKGIVSAGSAGFFMGFSAAGAAVDCADAFNQIDYAKALSQLEGEVISKEKSVIIENFNSDFNASRVALESAGTNLRTNLVTVNGILGEIEGEKQKARRAVSKALWLLTAEAAETETIDSLTRVREETARLRYERAHVSAKRYAYLAKRAIEARLGVSLASMEDDLPLVEAPSRWEASVCATEGIDLSGDALSKMGDTHSFADTFIGSYVDSLEKVVESYRLEYNFLDGDDTIVASLRDDIKSVRSKCETESPNLLSRTASFDEIGETGEPASQGFWVVAGCPVADETCVRADRISGSVPFGAGGVEGTPIQSSSISFTQDAVVDESRLVQRVRLDQGRYLFSWYSSDSSIGPSAASAIVLTSQGEQLNYLEDGSDKLFVVNGTSGDWNRFYLLFDVLDSGYFDVGFKFVAGGEELNVAGPMLEHVLPNRSASEYRPRVFAVTGSSREAIRQACPDLDGSTFRREAWKYACETDCADGFGVNCVRSGPERCFWETDFYINQRAFGSGDSFKHGGFARGNFNYRIEEVAINFVGSGLRSCESSESPQTCFAAGYLPYSLYHVGPYYVVNHKGESYDVPLFSGKIQHARGLATERYVSNPMSDSDLFLLQQFQRREFVGRPMDGQFVLRVWDEPGVDFGSLEDVQLVLNYRYWTQSD